MNKILNNAVADSMLPEGRITKRVVGKDEARKWLEGEYVHAGNPTHGPTWVAASALLGVESVKSPKGGKVALASGDELLVVAVNGLPRETREFTQAEIEKATMSFSLYTIG